MRVMSCTTRHQTSGSPYITYIPHLNSQCYMSLGLGEAIQLAGVTYVLDTLPHDTSLNHVLSSNLEPATREDHGLYS